VSNFGTEPADSDSRNALSFSFARTSLRAHFLGAKFYNKAEADTVGKSKPEVIVDFEPAARITPSFAAQRFRVVGVTHYGCTISQRAFCTAPDESA
jgi:hypothetical protein